VLFLGNSYTYVNDLPAMVVELASSAGKQMQVSSIANGSETLAQHAASASDLSAIASGHWSDVVMQEQSQIPSTQSGRETEMFPAVRTLDRAITAAGARPILYLTFAHQGGWPENGLPDYRSMQDAIDTGYEQIATETGSAVAPVGLAWDAVVSGSPGISMWQSDGSHPTVAGTYLAACVFFDSLFLTRSHGLHYPDGVSAAEADAIQNAADAIVLANPGQWHLR
jgi:hypothetical protein